MDLHVNGGPTDRWEEALVSGNGRQGALLYGGPVAIRVTLSHERLFLPVDAPLPPPDTAAVLGELRALLRAGAAQEAADLVMDVARRTDPGYARLRHPNPFVGAATLTFLPYRAGGAGYTRWVAFDTGTVGQSWDGLRQELFVSRADDLVVTRLAAPHGTLSGRLRLGPVAGAPPVPIVVAGTADAEGLALSARFPGAWPGAIGGYAVRVRVLVRGGTGTPEPAGTAWDIRDAHEVLLLARTTVDGHASPGPDPAGVAADFETLRRRHAARHGPLLSGVGLRVEPRVDRLFDACRYAIVSSVGTLPPTLQGVWSGDHHPAWSGAYTLDGNLPAAVSALSACGTPELMLPLFDLLEAYREDFRANARRLYGAPGILLPAHLSAHGLTNHFSARWCLTFWTGAAAWMARLYYDHWRYTRDEEFLRRRALPFLTDAAEFYAHFARDGVLPSYSPENSPAGDEGPQAAVEATMEVAAIRELLDHLAELGVHRPEFHRLRERLPAYRVADDGTLAEWLPPGVPANHAHRHASHLYPLWYEPDPALLGDPALYAAACATVRARLAWWLGQGDEMAFGLVQIGLAAANLGLAEEAYACLDRLASRYFRPSLVSTHNAGELFNVDICGGFPALALAMLVGSRGTGEVVLLPALPRAWPSGEVRGVLARDGVRVRRLRWYPGGLRAELVCAGDREIGVHTPGAATVEGAPWEPAGPGRVRVRMRPGSPVNVLVKH